MTVGELHSRMDSRELSSWMAYDRIEASRTDRLIATLCALMFNVHRDKSARPRSAEDYLGLPRPKQSPDAVAAKLKMWAMMKGAG
jgi:hypothetical protein